MTTITNALPVSEAHEEWKREHALLESMYSWANNEHMIYRDEWR
jgi:hypothetical protein